MFVGFGPGLRNAIDAGTLKAANETKEYARTVIRGALGLRAANTIGLKYWPDANKPLAVGLYSRWHRGQEDIPYAFSVGATVNPRRSRFLAVPATLNRLGDAGRRGGAGGLAGTSYASGQIDTSAFVRGGLTPGNRRYSTGTDTWSGRRRITPVIFSIQSGLGLRYVPPTGGRRFGLLVADVPALAGVDKSSRLPSGRLGTRRITNRPPRQHKVTVVAFLLLPQTKVPQVLDWDAVIGRAQELLAQDVLAALPPNILDAVRTGMSAGVPLYEVTAR